MGVLRFIWRGVLAFDRVGKRVPQLIQTWLIEFLFVIPLMFFIAGLIDIRGAFGVPGTGGSISGAQWGALAVSAVFGFLFVRSLVRPRLVQTTWTPMVRADVGPVTVYGGNRAWAVTYTYLTSHPSYILLQLLTVWIPLVMVWMTVDRGDETFYYRVAGYTGLVLLGLIAVARLLSWYVFRCGRAQLDTQLADAPISATRLAWEMAWKPLIMLLVLIYAVSAVPVGYMWWQEQRTIAHLPEVTAADGSGHEGEFFRVRGAVAGEPVYWAPRGTGRGGNNYAGAGVLVDLESGGDALLLAEALSVPDFVGVMKKAGGGVLNSHGRVIESIDEDQRTYYGFDLDDFGEPPPEGRVMLLLEYP